MTRGLVVPDSLYQRVRKEFGVQQQIDLVATAAAYNMVSRFLVVKLLSTSTHDTRGGRRDGQPAMAR